jgi:hypothetical protein
MKGRGFSRSVNDTLLRIRPINKGIWTGLLDLPQSVQPSQLREVVLKRNLFGRTPAVSWNNDHCKNFSCKSNGPVARPIYLATKCGILSSRRCILVFLFLLLIPLVYFVLRESCAFGGLVGIIVVVEGTLFG